MEQPEDLDSIPLFLADGVERGDISIYAGHVNDGRRGVTIILPDNVAIMLLPASDLEDVEEETEQSEFWKEVDGT